MTEEQTRLMQEIRDSLALSARCQQQVVDQQRQLLEHQREMARQQQAQRRWGVMFAVGMLAIVAGANAMLFARVLRSAPTVPPPVFAPAPPMYAPPSYMPLPDSEDEVKGDPTQPAEPQPID